MKNNEHPLTRRRFLRATGAAGLGVMLLPSQLWAAAPDAPKVSRRPFGRTGVDVPVIGLGCMFDIINNQIILRQAVDHGVTYWDTAAGYGNGASETGIGNFLEKNPEVRKELFIVTKASRARSTADMTELLDGSLARMKTSHADLYFVHGISSISRVDTPEMKTWAEQAKKSGKIKFFGFSTHSNMAQCLMGASKLDWIDGVMFTYNYREMHNPEMKAALAACEKAGIGLTAMKTMGGRSEGETPEAAALLEPLTKRGFTPGQAKLKVVMENPQIACACVQMPNLKFCRENIAAALDRTSLGRTERIALDRHAEATCRGYCAGCSHLCEPALADAVPVRDVMRHLMYHHHYPEVDARALFAELPSAVREQLPLLDYSAAERACPHRLPIAQLMRDAVQLLA